MWRLSEGTFTAVLTFGSVKSLLFFCIMVHCRGCGVARVLLCALGGGSGLKTLKFNTQ
ncbi:hypothetical protein BUN20_10705 [Bacteroides fragilis]|uniref:Uncharacterized protein n=1 Tax=Bacteroides fragilis 3_1_12 TaxID=457424 RepID=A0ABN0BN22_BACFG|nr:hypothetical protein BUN20_10705 [Bacteroides fragilis]EFR54296.1 hypothetical protein BFAG_02994 [Bacteroides fragilis 3_1_12]